MIAKYEFKELSEDRVKKLSTKLGVELNEKHTLADIYNSSDISFKKDKPKIGFNK